MALRNRRVEELQAILDKDLNDHGEKLSPENKEYLVSEIERAKTNANFLNGNPKEILFAGFVIGFIVACMAVRYIS